ncbi:MAG: pyridoxal phosphate-dependent aminotransferase [Planctomycetota bacterium]|jgi:aspartate aminotransferase
MTKLSRRAGSLSESVTLALNAKAKAIAAQGERVIRFGVGEPDFDTPDYIKDAARRALDEGVGKYTPVPGTPALRDAVAESFRTSGVACEPNDTIISCGAKHSLYNAIAVLADDGDEVVLPAPYWVSYPSMIQASGAEARIVDTRADGCILTPEALDRVANERTRALVMVSPGNPTGVTHSKEQMRALIPVLEKYPDITVISDEIYRELVYGDTVFWSFAAACPELADRTVTVQGVSKSHAMTGWRIGYATGPADVVKAMTRFQSHSTSNPTAIAQAAALAALTGPREPIEQMRQTFDRRRQLMVKRLGEIDGFSLFPPTGAFYCFPDIGRKVTPLDFCDRLLEEERVACVAGEAFGAESNIRLSYATSEGDINEGCDRIKRFIASL